jgi:predicted  nucleic acid-binding Zn-ribbon protein
MSKIITNYKNFLLEADSTETEIGKIRLEISKVKDQISEAKKKMNDEEKSAQNQEQKYNAEITYIGTVVPLHNKMATLMGTLKSKLSQKSAENK